MTGQHHMAGGAHETVLKALRVGRPMTVRELTFCCEPLAYDTVRGALTELMHEHRVERVSRGVYRLTED